MSVPASRKSSPSSLGKSAINACKRLVLGRLIARQKLNLPKKVARYFSTDESKAPIISRLQSHGASMIPYAYTDSYTNLKVTISYDPLEKLKYADVEGKKVYFPLQFSDELIVESVQIALMEQDPRSPHRYLPTETIEVSGRHAILCGASDGIYAMTIIDQFERVSLFEPDLSWKRPIQLTLRDSIHKVEIIPRAVSDRDTSTTTTLDSFTRGDSIDYLQADIEGDEGKLLRGAEQTLANSPEALMSICCYHTATQEMELTAILRNMRFSVVPSTSFVLMWMQYPLRPPYLRRAVLYAGPERELDKAK